MYITATVPLHRKIVAQLTIVDRFIVLQIVLLPIAHDDIRNIQSDTRSHKNTRIQYPQQTIIDNVIFLVKNGVVPKRIAH